MFAILTPPYSLYLHFLVHYISTFRRKFDILPEAHQFHKPVGYQFVIDQFDLIHIQLLHECGHLEGGDAGI